MPYPRNPQPCGARSAAAADCIPATAFSRYLFLPATSPLTLPNDFGSDNWKMSSATTGDPEIDGNPQELFGVKGASVDRAWQVATGRPDVLIAVLDSGIRWQDQLPDLVNKFYLNRGELPVPENSTNAADPWDRNGDGVFTIRDYLADDLHAPDSRVSDQNGNGMLDPEDLIFRFSDGLDDDQNGYVDDIAGWDFFEDDNDPLDEVRYGHGTGEAEDSNAEAGNGVGGVGTCPSCLVMPVRVGDSFIAEVNSFGQGVLFATDSGARVVQEALGTLNHSSLAQAAIDYAYHQGVVVVASAADEESNHHNYPANYHHTVTVNSVTRFEQLGSLSQTPPSYLYLNGCTNFGGHIAVAVPSSSCSSEATGKSAGIAGLIYAAALNEIDRGHLTRYPNDDGSMAPFPLSANEVQQLLTSTADDINFDARPDIAPPLPQNYSTQSPFPGVRMSERFHSIAGWDQYFGYGRINADAAVRRVAAGMIPPEADISSPEWFQIVNPDAEALPVLGRVAANRVASYAYSVEVAPGVQPAEADFQSIGGETAQASPRSGTLAMIPLGALAARMPHGVDGTATDADGRGDPDRFTFTVRVRVVDTLGNRAEDRRTLFLHRDPDLVGGQPLRLPSDGAASPVLADLDGDGVDDLILATGEGVVHAYRGLSGDEVPGWPQHTDPLELHTTAPAFRSGAVPMPAYAAVLGTPVVGDLDRTGTMQVIAADIQGKLYVWNADGTLRTGFPVSTIADYSNRHRSERDLATADGRVPDRTNRHDRDNRLARGFGAGPALGNLDGSTDGSLEIIIGGLDRHIYAWHADGSAVRGWPVLVKDPAKVEAVDPITNEVTLKADAQGKMGTKIITPVSLGDLDGDGTLDVVAGVNEEYSERPNAIFNNLTISLYRASGVLNSGNGRAYALFHDGTMHGTAPIERGWNPDAFLPGWPVKVAMLTQELLPTVGTGINGPAALADVDGDGRAEAALFSFLGPAYVFDGEGRSFLGESRPGIARTLGADLLGTGSNSIDAPAYPALGGGVLTRMAGSDGGFQFIAPTAGLGRLVDANLAAHQTPNDNQLAVWDVTNSDGAAGSGEFRPAFPRFVNDVQFLATPSVADIDDDGLPEVLAGSGVYDLHAINVNGVEPPGWPKFTGGWTAATPAVGDIDGDGRLEVVEVTREGLLFVWKTAAAECSPAPWRQYHHDQWSSGNDATDARPPAPVLARAAALSAPAPGTVVLSLSAVPGDDLYCGAPADLDVRWALQPIVDAADFAAATRFSVANRPLQSGRDRAQDITLLTPPPDVTRTVYVAVRATDATGNHSAVTAIGQTTLLASPQMASPADADGCALDAHRSHNLMWPTWALLLLVRMRRSGRIAGSRALIGCRRARRPLTRDRSRTATAPRFVC
jgi:hypothetical protein